MVTSTIPCLADEHPCHNQKGWPSLQQACACASCCDDMGRSNPLLGPSHTQEHINIPGPSFKSTTYMWYIVTFRNAIQQPACKLSGKQPSTFFFEDTLQQSMNVQELKDDEHYQRRTHHHVLYCRCLHYTSTQHTTVTGVSAAPKQQLCERLN
jgi:hypothetical protein